MRDLRLIVCFFITFIGFTPALLAQEKSGDDNPIVFTVADGAIQFSATSKWEKVKPRSNMLEAEFKIPKIGDDEQDARLTIMGAGGSVQANIDRWIEQFTDADGQPVKGIEPTQIKVADQTVHMVDISGTFADSMGGPQGPKTQRKNYRMLGSIIETEKHGKHFVKLYGPKATMDANADAFKAMIMSMTLPGEKPADSAKPIVFNAAGGGLEFTATGAWNKVKPRSTMLEVEFQIPKSEGDKNDGRLTMMGAGGSVQANLDRWVGQFTNADGSPVSDAKTAQMKVAGCDVHMIDISGTYSEGMGGPLGPKTDLENYRMLGAIIETESSGTYFVKFYGPAKTIGDNADKFKDLIMSMKVRD